MKTKITLSIEQAQHFILAHMISPECQANVEVEITGGDDPLYVKSIRQVIVEFPNHDANQKISAIKKLRELVPGLGLADAKVAVERPQDAINYYLTNRKYLQYSY